MNLSVQVEELQKKFSCKSINDALIKMCIAPNSKSISRIYEGKFYNSYINFIYVCASFDFELLNEVLKKSLKPSKISKKEIYMYYMSLINHEMYNKDVGYSTIKLIKFKMIDCFTDTKHYYQFRAKYRACEDVPKITDIVRHNLVKSFVNKYGFIQFLNMFN